MLEIIAYILLGNLVALVSAWGNSKAEEPVAVSSPLVYVILIALWPVFLGVTLYQCLKGLVTK